MKIARAQSMASTSHQGMKTLPSPILMWPACLTERSVDGAMGCIQHRAALADRQIAPRAEVLGNTNSCKVDVMFMRI